MAERSALLRAPKNHQSLYMEPIVAQKIRVKLDGFGASNTPGPTSAELYPQHNTGEEVAKATPSGAMDQGKVETALSGTVGANYRNYSVLSKVVKDVKNPSRAIDESLKTM